MYIYCFLFFVIFIIFSLFFGLMSGLSFFFVEWIFLGWKFYFYFNSLVFSFILLVVSSSVLVFSAYYLSSEVNFYYYFVVLLIFIGSMFSLVCSSGGLSMLISWDLLGISSFFLVLFYNNWDSCSGAMNTVLTNRVGDFFIFVFFSSLVFGGFYFFSGYFVCSLLFLVLVLAGFTKSAQFPFSAWLPKAMSAPTPISSLVHSSTLVTAGLILMINYSEVLLSMSISFFLVVGGIFTMCFSSILALLEEDLKKVVALSTLSQMGFATLTVGLGLGFISFVHLVSHALFKSCLFMQIGYLIHTSFGQQDGRGYSSKGGVSFYIQLQLLVTLFCLCGLIFTSGAVSKDYILELYYYSGWGSFFSFMFFFSIFLTFGYSYRLWKGLFVFFKSVVMYLGGSVVMSGLSTILIIFSISFLWWMSMNFLFIPCVMLYVDFYVPVCFLLVFMLVFWFILKVLFPEGVWSFFNHYLSKVFSRWLVDLKFLDNFLTSFNMGGLLLVLRGFYWSGGSLISGGFNSLVVILFVLLLFL